MFMPADTPKLKAKKGSLLSANAPRKMRPAVRPVDIDPMHIEIISEIAVCLHKTHNLYEFLC